MDDSSKDVDRSASKRSKMRESLGSAFGDPLQSFKTPTAVRQRSQTLDNESAELEGRIRKISSSSDEPIGEDPERTSLYMDQRQNLLEALEVHLKKSREIIREAHQLSSNYQKRELKRALKELDETDSILLKERAALAADRIRVKYGVQGQMSSVKIGEAYMMAITQNLPAPADASYKRQPKRSSADQSSFRNRLIKAYDPNGSKFLETPNIFQTENLWCPVSGNAFDLRIMTAAHIVPYAIGEENAAYLFGTRPDEGYSAIWSERNGLMLHYVLKEVLDDGRMVIMPDPTDSNEFISIVLSQDLLRDGKQCPAVNGPWTTIHNRRLQFQTMARPGKRELYMRALLSVFMRRRYDVPGWESDRGQVFNGKIWAPPGKWARKSMMEALALEIGDTWDGIDAEGGLGDFPDRKLPEEEKRIATVMRYALETRPGDGESEDDE